MGGWGVVITDSQLLVELSEMCVIKLASIVWDKHFRDSKTAKNFLPNEASDVLLSDLCQWLCLHPFSRTINPYHQEHHLPCPHGEGTKHVKSPLGKGLKGHHWSKVFWWPSRYIVLALTLVTRFGICLHGWPVVSCVDYFVDEWSGPWMISTGSFADVPHNVVGLVWSQTP